MVINMSNIKTVSVGEIEEISQEIRKLLASLDNTLSILSENNNELLVSATEFGEYNGAEKSDSKSIAIDSAYQTMFHEEFKVDGFEGVIHLANSLLKEIESLLSMSKGIQEIMNTIDDSASIIAIYMKTIEDTLDEDTSFLDRLKKVNIIMEEDAKNNYEILLSTPLLCNGTSENVYIPYYYTNEDGKQECISYESYSGPYLKMYTVGFGWAYAPLGTVVVNRNDDKGAKIIFEAMNEDERNSYTQKVIDYNKSVFQQGMRYTDKFRYGINKNLESISYINYSEETEWGNVAAVTKHTSSGSGLDKICIPMDQVDPNNVESYNFMVEAVNHELGHVYDNYLQKEHFQVANSNVGFCFSNNDSVFQDVQSQVNSADPNYDFIRDYGQDYGVSESFAEYTAEYFGNGSDLYNPDDLRQIDIHINGEDMTLYDYMDYILNY